MPINLRQLERADARRYATAGVLLSYQRPDSTLIRSTTIYRDGTIVVRSFNSGGIVRRLSNRELRELEGAFLGGTISKLDVPWGNVSEPSLSTIFGRLRYARLDGRTVDSDPYIARLEKLIDRLLVAAEFRITYRWRSRIKDWEYGDIFPLDEASDRASGFVTRNWERLSKLTVPQALYEEAKNRDGEVNRFFYRFKGKFYYFELASCTDRPTGTWTCSHLAETGAGDSAGKVIGPFFEWPSSLAVSLRQIPDAGLLSNHDMFGSGIAVPTKEFQMHRDFYSKLFWGGGIFREGDHVYRDVKVWFR